MSARAAWIFTVWAENWHTPALGLNVHTILVLVRFFIFELKAGAGRTDGQTDRQDTYCGLAYIKTVAQ